ncbi:c-type cytochrome [Desulfuromonas versatilis]|uniref:C-type cytochrome n=1 Tax=Desulfuromonas versatilis TaxID=2802975 RepID=A0ABN6E395_9BACT|nr:cytochrome c3 family protein [Desulfuromonas versatilis]BCR06682.1 c-type cytochrome [Desulfuromonas versatilis]
MKFKAGLLALIGTLVISGVVLAVPPGRVLEFNDSPLGKVVFDGKVHQEAGAKCKECHNDEMFPKMKQGTVKVTMAEIYAGRLCGVCHNGKRAFGTEGNCARCHIKP